jgi:ComF family protein
MDVQAGYRHAMWLRSALSRWFVARCAICAVAPGKPIVCEGCAEDFFASSPYRCPRCAITLPVEGSVCASCLRHPPQYDATITLADYAAPIDGLVLALKFGHRLELAPILGALLAARVRSLSEQSAVLVPVPLAYERLAERGFNQSLEIARATARSLGARLDCRCLARIRHAAAQASLSLDARRRNIRGAFLVRGNVRGLRLIVIDDVMTSGSTLDEVARVLKGAGAEHVTNLVVARTP